MLAKLIYGDKTECFMGLVVKINLTKFDVYCTFYYVLGTLCCRLLRFRDFSSNQDVCSVDPCEVYTKVFDTNIGII